MLSTLSYFNTHWFGKCLSKVLVVFTALGCISAQAVPGTDISLFKILTSKQGISLEFEKTLVKRPGYDNQPAFTLESKSILYTKMIGEQTDIWEAQLSDGTLKAITKTLESEYSPTPLGANTFSSVIAHEGKQTLWKIVDGKHHSLLSGEIEPVGYHTWTAEHYVAMFRLAEPHELVLYSVIARGGPGTLIAKDIGRSLAAEPVDGLLFYIQNSGEDAWLTEYNLEQGSARELLRLFPGQQDFAWHRDIGFIHSDGQSLYLSSREAPNWVKLEVTDNPKFKDISRLAISPSGEWLAVVHADL